ncbi:uncharacterized protein LOC130675947 [Microplitis mediator]|uniref:uncharacterized protein LOC130675947 n=1 Tax=Microplitis mediator TaxID=375433 RepID=UPI0025543FCE|nr:uncharacterized protein LOC130675947 [Microplitis mediator]
MSHCMVRGCNPGHRKNREKKHLFSAPKDFDLRKKWQIAIRRNDIELKTGHRVCEKHFLPDQIQYQRILRDQNGAVLGVSPYTNPQLVPNVVPSKFWWNDIYNQFKKQNLSTEPNSSFPVISEVVTAPISQHPVHSARPQCSSIETGEILITTLSTPHQVPHENSENTSKLTFEGLLSDKTLQFPI